MRSFAKMGSLPLVLLATGCLVLGCGDDTELGSGGGGPGSGGSPATGGGGATSTGGSGAGGGGGAIYVPTPEDVGFVPLNAVPPGEQILYNDWSFPDQVKSMAPDGSGATPIFSIYRVWAMTVSRAGDRIAFSCGDPEQEEHYGITLGDAIQHTWLYEMASESITPIAYGNINDECHHFGPGDTHLYLCRRYDFVYEPPEPPSYFGYRIGRIELSALADPSMGFSWLVPESADFTLHPQVVASEMYFDRVVIQGASQHRSIERLALPSGTPELVRDAAYAPRLSPDGTRLLYADATQGSALFVADLEGENPTLVAAANGTSPSWSPDGTRIAYLLWANAVACAHVEVVNADGSTANDPERIVDCALTGENITELAWFVRP
jgi:hypothetical protein